MNINIIEYLISIGIDCFDLHSRGWADSQEYIVNGFYALYLGLIRSYGFTVYKNGIKINDSFHPQTLNDFIVLTRLAGIELEWKNVY